MKLFSSLIFISAIKIFCCASTVCYLGPECFDCVLFGTRNHATAARVRQAGAWTGFQFYKHGNVHGIESQGALKFLRFYETVIIIECQWGWAVQTHRFERQLRKQNTIVSVRWEIHSKRQYSVWTPEWCKRIFEQRLSWNAYLLRFYETVIRIECQWSWAVQTHCFELIEQTRITI